VLPEAEAQPRLSGICNDIGGAPAIPARRQRAGRYDGL